MLVERTSVGLDVHARSVAAAAIEGVTGKLRQARLTPSHDQIRSWIRELDGPVAVAYEAGPTGFGLYRCLTAAGVRCVVVAPSKLQRPSGDRVKTDAKDAVHLARLLRLGEITPVAAMAFESDYDAVQTVAARRDRLDNAITQLAADSEFTPIVHRLGCLRGIATLTAFALAVEIGDWHRFTGNSIGSFIGLVPSEHSSGSARVQGPITKTGNTHARRLLVEAAWHHRANYRPGKTMRDRWELVPAAVRQRGDLGNRRLHERWVAFNLRRKRPVIANVAIARELAGWCWSLAVMD